MIEIHRVGYSDGKLLDRIPEEERAVLRKIGLINRGRELFANCIVVPIFHEGRVSELYGRRIGATRASAPSHLYLPGPHKGVWNLDGLKTEPWALLMESIFDVMAMWRAGYRNVTAAFGVHGLT